MAVDQLTLNSPTIAGGDKIAVDRDADGADHQYVKIEFGAQGTRTPVTSTDRLPVDPGTVAVTGTFFQATQPVSAASLPLPTGAATAARQDTGNASLSSIDGKITAVNTGAVVVSSSALPSGASTLAKQDTGNTSLASIDGKITAVNTGAVVVASSALPTGAATETTLGGVLTTTDFDTKTGALTETAPATDTASSGLNGRLQRIAQRLTSLIALLPAALGAGGGLKVDGSGTALPMSVASLPLPTGASTAAKQPALGTAGTASADVISIQGIASMTAVKVDGSAVTQPISLNVPTTVSHGLKTVTTAGTRVTLAGSTTVKSATIKALSTNTGFIYVGSTTVSSANGFQLSAGDTVSLDVSDLNTVNLDSSVNGEGVTYIAVN